MRFAVWKCVLFFVIVLMISIQLFPSGRELGLLYFRSHNYDQMLAYLQKQFRQDPKDLPNAFRYLAALKESGRFEDVEEEAKVVLALYPDNYEIHKFMGKFYEDRIIMSRAHRYWLKLYELDPSQEDILKKIIYYYYSIKNHRALIRLYEQQIQAGENDLGVYYEIARLYSLEHNLEKAKAVYRQIMENFPNDTKAKRKLAELLELTGKSYEALELYRQLTTLEPKSVDSAALYLEKLFYYNRQTEAFVFGQEIVKRFSQSQPFVGVVAGYFSDIEDMPRLRGFLEAFYKIDEKESVTLRLLAELYHEERHYEEALRLLQEIHSQDKCDYYTHYLLGNIYDFLGKSLESDQEYRLALKHLERYDGKYSAIPDKLVKAEVLHKLGQKKESLLVLNLILGRDPNNPYALALIAGQYLDLRRMRLAKKNVEHLFDTNQNNGKNLKFLSEVYLESGDYQKAEQLLGSYHEKTGGDYRSYQLYGNVLANLGDSSGSQRAYTQALRLLKTAK